jgi:hypothetical protein
MAGRKATDPANPRTDKLAFRLSADLVRRVREAATDGGRTVSQEVARRLAASFNAGAATQDRFGGVNTHFLCLLISLALAELRAQTGHNWHSDRFTFDHAIELVKEDLSYFRPAGEPEVPEDLPAAQRLRDQDLDPAPVLEQAKSFPFGVLAARLAAFKVETATPESEPVYQRIKEEVGRRMVGSPRADLVNWRAPE